EELNIMLDISQKTLIPLSQEIALCQAHLEVMNYRKEKNYVLKLDGDPSNAWIPPAILHTLVENGISHDSSDQNEISFFLKFQENHNKQEYYMLTSGTREEESTSTRKEGTGLRYIKARLEESYPGNWEFYAGPGKEGWESLIIFKKKALGSEGNERMV
ncbi:MAG: regulator, partial [Bacteroidota bacterium]